MCTEFLLPKTTGFRISGRTMDFASTSRWQLAAVPKNTEMTGFPVPSLKHSASRWKASRGFLGIGIQLPEHLLGQDIGDAMNTEGLTAAGLWLPGSKYPRVKDAPDDAKLVSALDICGWAASNFSSVQDLLADLKAIQQGKPISSGEVIYFWDPFQEPETAGDLRASPAKNYLPLHFQFHDKSGASLVLEFRNGRLELTDNTKLGVLANNPFLDWHRANLGNYLSVTNVETDEEKILGLAVKKPGNGGGTIGLSYSPLPSDRFLRTVMTLNFSIPWLLECKKNEYAVAHALNVLSGVTVVRGQCIDQANGTKGDFTQWRIVRDQENSKLYLARTESFGTWCVDFKDYELARGQAQFVPIPNATNMPVLKP